VVIWGSQLHQSASFVDTEQEEDIYKGRGQGGLLARIGGGKNNRLFTSRTRVRVIMKKARTERKDQRGVPQKNHRHKQNNKLGGVKRNIF